MVNDEHLPQRQPEGMPHPANSAPSLVVRIRAALGKDASKVPEPFDAANPMHIDAAARVLLRRFYERNDARSFELLVELTQGPLDAMAHDVVREIGLPIAPDVLHGAMMGALFIDTRPAQVDVRQFLSFARRKLDEVARARALWLAKRPIPHLERLPSGLVVPRAPYPGAPFDSDPPEDPVAIDALVQSSGPSAMATSVDFDALGFDFSWLVETLFHRLDQEARVLLRAAEIERKSLEAMAEWREMDVDVVTQRVDAARAALTTSIEDVCARLAAKARRVGCTLSGKSPADITAEDVARHLISCDACLKALDASPTTARDAQRKVLAALGSRRPAAAPMSAVERLITDARGRGKDELGRFFAELARACLLQIPEVESRSPSVVAARDPDEVASGAMGVALRIESDISVPSTQQRLEAARACALGLIRVEGRTARASYLLAHVAIAAGTWSEAKVILEGLLDDPAGALLHEHASQSLLVVLHEMGERDKIVETSRRLIERQIAVRSAWYALALAEAGFGHAEACRDAARQFADAILHRWERRAWASRVRAESHIFANALGCSTDEVHELLGLSLLEGDP